MERIKLLLLYSCIFWVVGCESDVPKSDKTKPTTFANFYVRFLQGENQAKAEASFSSGMTQEDSKPLKIQNGVFFYNGNMNEREVKGIGTRYSYDFNGNFAEAYRFQFNDPLKGKINHELKINPILNFSLEKNISKSKGTILTWEGTPLSENESLVFLISDAKNKLTNFEVKGKTNESKITIPKEQLTKLELGKAKMYLVRKQSQVIQEPNFVAMSEMEFYTKETTVNIIP